MARRRQRRQEEPENHERWLVSYADFITLLFAFFVVMYAISSVNEGKYRVLSESLNAVFSEEARSEDPIQIGDPIRTPVSVSNALAEPDTSVDQDAPTDDSSSPARVSAEHLAAEVQASMQDYIDRGLVTINVSDNRVEIEMKDKMLFGSGVAKLSDAVLPALRSVGKSLSEVGSQIQVEGHTDNVPITTSVYPSNWELSAARAASVVNYLSQSGVEPWRLAAVGLGEFQPIAENSTANGRSSNRRVKLIVLTDQAVPPPSYVDYDVPWAEGPGLKRR